MVQYLYLVVAGLFGSGDARDRDKVHGLCFSSPMSPRRRIPNLQISLSRRVG